MLRRAAQVAPWVIVVQARDEVLQYTAIFQYIDVGRVKYLVPGTWEVLERDFQIRGVRLQYTAPTAQTAAMYRGIDSIICADIKRCGFVLYIPTEVASFGADLRFVLWISGMVLWVALCLVEC